MTTTDTETAPVEVEGPTFTERFTFVEWKTKMAEFHSTNPTPASRLFDRAGRQWIYQPPVRTAVEELDCPPEDVDMVITVTFVRRTPA